MDWGGEAVSFLFASWLAGKDGRRPICQRAVRTKMIIVVAPTLKLFAGISDAEEDPLC